MKLSVVTVCYNCLEELVKTVNSVMEQTFTDFEYIVVDGGSKDGTIEYLRSLAEKFAEKNKIFRFVSERDEGTYDAMNKGAMMAHGEFINYMNAGDSFYDADTLLRFFSHKIEAEAGILFGDTFQVYDFGCGIARYEDYKADNPIMPFCHQSCFVKTHLVQAYKFNTSYRIIADHDLFFRLHQNNVLWQYVKEIVARYNGQYGLSANNPLLLRLEGLKVHQVDDKWYYPFVLVWTYLRYGWISRFKKWMPNCLTTAWMKHKRRYI